MLKPFRSAAQRRRRERRRRAIVGLFITFLLLLIVGVGAAAYYAYYQSKNAPEVAEEPPLVPKTQQLPAVPDSPAKNAKIGVSLTAPPPPVVAGGNTSVTIKTLQSAACSITFTYNDNKKPINDSGLIPKTADEFGVLSWTWTVPGDATPGTWPITVVCAYEQQSAMLEASVVVKPN